MTQPTMTPVASSSTGASAFPGTRGLRLYALASFAAIAIAAGLFALKYEGAARQMVLVSAGLAFVVQMVTFAVARLLAASGHGIAGWGLGAVACFVVLAVYGFVCRAMGLPLEAALISLATFFFLTEVIEPPFLTI
jgi:hypothetical protein